MRKLLGTVVFLGGVAGLGYWGANSHAVRMQSDVTDKAAELVSKSIHGINSSVSGRDITVTGLADSESEKAALLDALNGVTGRRVVVDDIAVLQSASPYTTSLTKAENGISGGGHLPFENLRADLGAMGANDVTGLKLASGAPAGWRDVIASGFAGLAQLDVGEFTLSDKTITLTGEALSAADREAALAAFADLPEGYELSSDISAPVIVSPYTTSLTKGDAGINGYGHFPSNAMSADLSSMGAKDIANMTLASGEPDGWRDAVASAFEGLAPLNTGAFTMTDQVLTLTGVALSPTERDTALAAFAGLPEGYELSSKISVLDDGKPLAYDVSFDASGTVGVAGKLPKGVSKDGFAAPLGLGDVSGEPTNSLIDAGDGGAKTLAALAGVKEWLPYVERGSVSTKDGKTNVMLEVVPGTDVDQLAASIKSKLPADDLTVKAAKLDAETGAERMNAFTNTDEEFFAGAWRPKLQFEATAAECTKRTNDVLAASKINFITGSAELDADAVTAINQLSAIMRRCTKDGGLSAILGGHTDTVGQEDANLALSRKRAKSVVAALADNGVLKGRMLAIGYGQTEPIADNATAEGRAKNRRTTIEWLTR